jgi:hypothetical protein
MNSSTSNNPTRLNSTNSKSHRKLVPLIITAACAFLLGRQTKTLELYTSDNALVDSINALQFAEQKITDSSEDDDSGRAIEPSNSFIGSHHRLENEDEADFIIRRSYLNSYAHILPCNNATTEKDCLDKTLQHFNPTTENARGALPPVPWWFRTLLRDTVANGAYGFWHHFSTTDPALNFCTIEKVGTTEWRRVFCDLNEDECPNNGDKYPPHCRAGLVGRKCAFQTNKKMPSDAPKAVFLRDPLERLLSAFLDKCIKPHVRKHEKHCEPNEVFNTDGWGRKNIVPTKQIEDHPKQFFAAYLDVMPLSWNVHFVPQALYCDLYRTIADYAFVGDMGKEFMVDLERMAHQFGKLQFQLDKTFGYVKGVEAKRHNNTGNSNHHATHAPEKVAMYYNAASVRKALEYLSIDYVVLGLEVPEWAREMLRKDTM